MIPKIIHYAWFGNKPLPKSGVECLKSWKKYCSDYEIKRWDESNYDFNSHQYTREAYAYRKYAFVTDYLRLEVLYKYGGIFFDTDVEVLKSYDPLLTCVGFTGFEHGECENEPVNVGIGVGVGSEARNPIIKAMLEDYADRTFIYADGRLDLTPCPAFQTAVLKRFGLILENRQQDMGNMIVFPTEYFCPKNYYTAETKITSNTYSIHHYSASWMPMHRKAWHFMTQKVALFRWIDRVRKNAQERKLFF